MVRAQALVQIGVPAQAPELARELDQVLAVSALIAHQGVFESLRRRWRCRERENPARRKAA